MLFTKWRKLHLSGYIVVQVSLVSDAVFYFNCVNWAYGITDNNSSLVPNASVSLQANASSSNKELQSQGLNEAIIRTFSSSNGLLRSTMPDGGLCANSEIMANGVFDDQAFQRTGSSHWSPVAVPVRTFTKVFIFNIPLLWFS